jgi:hypothetical protein
MHRSLLDRILSLPLYVELVSLVAAGNTFGLRTWNGTCILLALL